MFDPSTHAVSCSAPLSAISATEAHWFAVYTSSRHEKWVAKNLMERQIENFLPLYEKVHCWNRRSPVKLQLPLFPNYVFARIAPQRRGSILAVPGVIALVGRGHVPSPLPQDEIEGLRAGLERGNFQPHPYFVAGQRVRIRAGALEGLEGILLRRKNEIRLVVTLELIQRSVAVEVDADSLEPLPRRRISVA